MVVAMAEKDWKENARGILFGYVSPDAPADLNPILGAINTEAVERLGLTCPSGSFMSRDDIPAEIWTAFAKTASVHYLDQHLIALAGVSDEKAIQLARMAAEIYEQGLVELDANDPDTAAKLKLYAKEPVIVYLRNLAGSKLESRLQFFSGERKMELDGEEIAFEHLSALYVPVSMEHPIAEGILDQAELLCLVNPIAKDPPRIDRPLLTSEQK